MEKKDKLICILCLIAGILLLVPVVCDGLINWFGLSQSIQYAYNFGAIVLGLPVIIFSTNLVDIINK